MELKYILNKFYHLSKNNFHIIALTVTFVFTVLTTNIFLKIERKKVDLSKDLINNLYLKNIQ